MSVDQIEIPVPSWDWEPKYQALLNTDQEGFNLQYLNNADNFEVFKKEYGTLSHIYDRGGFNGDKDFTNKTCAEYLLKRRDDVKKAVDNGMVYGAQLLIDDFIDGARKLRESIRVNELANNDEKGPEVVCVLDPQLKIWEPKIHELSPGELSELELEEFIKDIGEGLKAETHLERVEKQIFEEMVELCEKHPKNKSFRNVLLNFARGSQVRMRLRENPLDKMCGPGESSDEENGGNTTDDGYDSDTNDGGSGTGGNGRRLCTLSADPVAWASVLLSLLFIVYCIRKITSKPKIMRYGTHLPGALNKFRSMSYL